MTELLPFLKSLLSVPGLSGHEGPARDLISAEWKPLVDELSISRLGSLHGLKRGSGSEPRPRLLLSAHMDAIGMMVTRIVDGFIRVTEIGGIDHRILPGQPVTVHGRRDLPAIVAQPTAQLLPPGKGSGPVIMDYLWIDTGLLPEEVNQLVRVGDLVSYAQEPLELPGECLSGHTLDNRASVAAVTFCLEELQTRRHAWDVWAVASVQEEETMGGALTSPFQIRPDLAVAIDVTFGKGPGSNEYNTFPLGKGVALGWGPNFHPALHKRFKEVADKLEIPLHNDIIARHSGTDAYGIQVVAEGIPSILLSIPLRYMHTPVETVSLKDIRRTGRLMAEFIARLESDFVQKITWEN
jgi:endoglucanase